MPVPGDPLPGVAVVGIAVFFFISIDPVPMYDVPIERFKIVLVPF